MIQALGRSAAEPELTAGGIEIPTQRLDFTTLTPGNPAIRCRIAFVLVQAECLALADVVTTGSIGMHVALEHWRRRRRPDAELNRLRRGFGGTDGQQAGGKHEIFDHFHFPFFTERSAHVEITLTIPVVNSF